MNPTILAFSFAGLVATSLQGFATESLTVASALPPGMPMPKAEQDNSSTGAETTDKKKSEETKGSTPAPSRTEGKSTTTDAPQDKAESTTGSSTGG